MQPGFSSSICWKIILFSSQDAGCESERPKPDLIYNCQHRAGAATANDFLCRSWVYLNQTFIARHQSTPIHNVLNSLLRQIVGSFTRLYCVCLKHAYRDVTAPRILVTSFRSMNTKLAEPAEADDLYVNRSETVFASSWNHIFPFSGHEDVRTGCCFSSALLSQYLQPPGLVSLEDFLCFLWVLCGLLIYCITTCLQSWKVVPIFNIHGGSCFVPTDRLIL